MPGYMSGSKRAKMIPSITNNICNLGGDKKGGLITATCLWVALLVSLI